MHITSRWTRAGGALAAVAATLALASVPAVAAPERTATTTSYTTATYLQHALGLPSSDTAPAIEPVTYDRFQWLLQQPGTFALLIGDPATDASFAQRAQDVEAAAQSKGIKKVYWFNPNLSGNAVVGTTTEPNLDIRNPSGINLAARSQGIYDNAWKSLIADYLGNGLSVTHNSLNSESATVTIASAPSARNDGGRTEFGNSSSGALYDYSSSTPAAVQDSYFVVYDKANAAAKIVGWTDLSNADAAATRAAVDSAVSRVGSASAFTEADQFAWWKDEVNTKHGVQTTQSYQGKDHPVLTDADAADGWDVEQITYPELVDLLKSGANDKNAVILFGGTWCPNTRPVLPQINKDAQKNGVHVFNFDTVLDGGLLGGTTTSANDPLQTRNTQDYSSTANSNPTFLYGDLVSQFFTNINTQYAAIATYYPGGNTGAAVQNAKKLQVPFLLGYGGNGGGTTPNAGVKRQWIIDNGGGAFTEYMTSWAYASPRAGELGIAPTNLPANAPIWSTVNSQLSAFTYATDPSTLYQNTTVLSDAAQYLVAGETASVSYDSSRSTWTIASGGSVDISPTALTAALTALGGSAPANLADAKTQLIAALSGSDAALTANLKTVVGAWQLVTNGKNAINKAWGNATTPGSVAGGLAALHAADVFFDGLPGGVLSHRTVTADASGITVRIDNDYGRNPAGNVALTLKKDGATVKTDSAAVAGGSAAFALGALDAGTYDYTLSYAGDDQIAAFTESGSLTVAPRTTTTTTDTTNNTPTTTTTTATRPATTPTRTTTTTPRATKASVGKVKVSLVKRPTSRKGGKYTVSIAAASGRSAVSGTVTIKLKKGSVTKTVRATLSRGRATFTLPKLAKGTWKVTITWPGNTTYKALSATAASIKVIK
jgi:thiol-disulfide isomerase/thioredoxin